jgi:hypothetical protein
MRLAAMQVDGDRRDRHVRERERGRDMAPPREIKQARKKHFQPLYKYRFAERPMFDLGHIESLTCT